MNKNITNTKGKIDWMITLVPLGIVIALCILFFLLPDQSNAVLSQIRFFFGDTFGTYYLVIGLGIFLLSLYIAGSKYGDIVLGEKGEKPKYSFFSWGAMMFTCGLAADILFYSFSEYNNHCTKKCKNKIKNRSCGNDGKTSPDRFAVECPFSVIFSIFPPHHTGTAKRNQFQ